jgi:hypothetical protein
MTNNLHKIHIQNYSPRTMKVKKIIAIDYIENKIDDIITVDGKCRKSLSFNLQIDEMKILLTILGLLNGVICYLMVFL